MKTIRRILGKYSFVPINSPFDALTISLITFNHKIGQQMKRGWLVVQSQVIRQMTAAEVVGQTEEEKDSTERMTDDIP